MKQKINNIKERITSKEVVLKFMIILLTSVLVYYSDVGDKKLINVIGFLAAFFISIWLHKHFFPLMTAALFFFLIASLQEFWNVNYIHNVVTNTYWKIGNVFLIVSVLKFAYNLKFRYKIVEHVKEDTDKQQA